MELAFLFGFLFIGGGSSLMFARDFWWEWQKFSNQTAGRASERTEIWDGTMILLGVIMMGYGLYISWQGIQLAQLALKSPDVSTVCPTLDSTTSSNQFPQQTNPQSQSPESDYSRYIRIACTALQQKDYHTALINFQRAREINSRPIVTLHLDKTIEYVEGEIEYDRP